MTAVLDALLDILYLCAAHQVIRIDAERVVAQMHDNGLRCDPLPFVERLDRHAMRRFTMDLALARTRLVSEVHPAVLHARSVTADGAGPYPAWSAVVEQLLGQVAVGDDAVAETGIAFAAHSGTVPVMNGVLCWIPERTHHWSIGCQMSGIGAKLATTSVISHSCVWCSVLPSEML